MHREHAEHSGPWYDAGPDPGAKGAGDRRTGPLPDRTPESRKKRKTTKMISLILCAAIVISAAALAFLEKGSILPGGDGPGRAEGGYEDEYSDYRDYFMDLYADLALSSGTNSLPRARGLTAPELALAPEPEGERLSLQEIYRQCRPATVGISTYQNDFPYASGTGIILTENGYILTNSHVLDDCDAADVILYDGAVYSAELVGHDPLSDVAVLKIEAAGLSPAQLGDSAALEVGDEVVAIGNPLGEDFRGTMTNGIVSAVDRDVSVSGRQMSYIQTNAALNEGNSGGPLINMHGQVVGITNMKMMSVYSSIEGIGFAIPTAFALPVARDLFSEKAEASTLGITVGVIPEEDARYFDIPMGLFILRVAEGSDAQKKGVAEGDILLAVDGRPVRLTQDVLAARDTLSPGGTLTLTLYRAGRTFDLAVGLTEPGALQTD